MYYSKSEEELKAAQELKDRVRAQVKESLQNPAAAREKRLRESREELVDLRDKLTNILKQDWKQFGDVEKVISDYVFLLSSYPCKRDETWSDISVDLNILKELRDKLEYKSAEAEKNHFKEQFKFLDAVQKRALMLRELELALQKCPCTLTPDMEKCFREILEGVDLEYMQEFADRKEEVLSKGRAKKYREEVQIREREGDNIEYDNPKLVIDQFKGYEEKVNEASSEIGDNLNVYIDSMPVLKAVKHILLQLEDMCSLNSKRMSLLKPDDDIKVEPDNGANLLKKALKAGQSGKSNRFKEVNSDNSLEPKIFGLIYCSPQKAMKAGKSGKTSNRFKELLKQFGRVNVRQAPKLKV